MIFSIKEGEVADKTEYYIDETIVKINRRRWEIEKFFMTCFIALKVYRYLKKKLDEKYLCNDKEKSSTTCITEK